MIKPNKKLPDYKDFFNVTYYLSTDIPDIFYKKSNNKRRKYTPRIITIFSFIRKNIS